MLFRSTFPHASLPKTKFAADSALEGSGFEPSVPRQENWSMPSSSDQTRVGRTLTLGGGAESSLEGRDIELSVSPKDIRTSPYDLCANRSDRRQSREGDRWFESTSLQRRARCESRRRSGANRHSGHPRVFRRNPIKTRQCCVIDALAKFGIEHIQLPAPLGAHLELDPRLLLSGSARERN